ncbi:MAG: DUF58 domain-containing protein [Oscillospiraceae bacterium]
MGKNRVLYLGALAGAFAFHAYYTAWVSWFALLLVLCLPVFSLLCSLPAMLGTELRAELPRRCKRGEGAKIEFYLQSGRGLLAPLCRFAFFKTDCMEGTTERKKAKLAGRQRLSVPLPTEHCGAVSCAFARGRVYDRLGLFALPLRLPGPMELLVEPLPLAPEPEPDLSRFRVRACKPKPGGGFSELHELREYRPGDSLRDVHWKLSAKTDKLIVREAQQPEGVRALITLDLRLPRSGADRTLDALSWLSARLLEAEAPHSVCWAGSEGGLRWCRVEKPEDIAACVEELLRQGLSEDGPSLAGRAFDEADWRWHLGGEGET